MAIKENHARHEARITQCVCRFGPKIFWQCFAISEKWSWSTSWKYLTISWLQEEMKKKKLLYWKNYPHLPVCLSKNDSITSAHPNRWNCGIMKKFDAATYGPEKAPMDTKQRYVCVDHMYLLMCRFALRQYFSNASPTLQLLRHYAPTSWVTTNWDVLMHLPLYNQTIKLDALKIV